MHNLRFTLRGQNLAAVEHLAHDVAAKYFGDAYEPLLTWSRAEPNTVTHAGREQRDGWKVTFRYHCRPVAQDLHSRRAVRAVPNTEPHVEPYGDGHPIEGAA